MTIGKLQTNVGFLNWAVGVIFATGLTAIITSFLLLSARIDDRYDKIGDKLDKLSEQINNLRVEVTAAEHERMKPKRR